MCPTNHYSSHFYEARKPSLLLIKEGQYYEPIYSFTIGTKKNSVTKLFSEYDPKLSKNMRAVFKDIIKPLFTAICKPLESMPRIYTAKPAILLYDLLEKLEKYKYKVLKQVMNFKNKIIGVIALSPNGKSGFIPCYPSALEEKDGKEMLEYVLMTENDLWKNYKETYEFLMELYNKSKKKKATSDIPCKPVFNVIEDELAVGFLTETNQFIQFIEPVAINDIPPDYELPSFKNSNYIIQPKREPMIQTDTIITTQNNVDQERVDYIEKLKFETNFYNVFRNTIRILLNDPKNISLREMIEKELLNTYLLYNQKLKKINQLVRNLVGDLIQFIGNSNYYKQIKEVSTCIIKKKETCEASPNLCTFTENGKCKLILPEKNLITQKDNETIYYGKISDELLRYNKIRSFMFQPQSYLSFGNISYQLSENEIIVMQSLLSQEYFENLIPAITNKYIHSNTYDEAEPIISQTYDNTVISNAQKIEEPCKSPEKSKITSQFWSECFPKNYKEIKYDKTISCGYKMLIDLLERKTNEKYTITQIKQDLYEEYKKYIEINETNKNKMIDILIIEGKKTLGDQVKSGVISFSNFIYDSQYFLTPFDLWILLQKYKISSFLISQEFLLQTEYKYRIFLTYGNVGDNFVFIVIPGLRQQNIPGYKMIETILQDVFVSLDVFNETKCNDLINNAFRNEISVEDYLNKFTKQTTTKYMKKKPILIIEEDEEEPEQIQIKENKEKTTKKIKEQKTITKTTKKQKNPTSQTRKNKEK
jgi:hypothetical protein